MLQQAGQWQAACPSPLPSTLTGLAGVAQDRQDVVPEGGLCGDPVEHRASPPSGRAAFYFALFMQTHLALTPYTLRPPPGSFTHPVTAHFHSYTHVHLLAPGPPHLSSSLCKPVWLPSASLSVPGCSVHNCSCVFLWVGGGFAGACITLTFLL